VRQNAPQQKDAATKTPKKEKDCPLSSIQPERRGQTISGTYIAFQPPKALQVLGSAGRSQEGAGRRQAYSMAFVRMFGYCTPLGTGSTVPAGAGSGVPSWDDAYRIGQCLRTPGRTPQAACSGKSMNFPMRRMLHTRQAGGGFGIAFRFFCNGPRTHSRLKSLS
jgi:hypothetical protein